MIGLTFDGNLLTAATLTDGGEIFAQAEQPALGNDYREWRRHARDKGRLPFWRQKVPTNWLTG